MLSLKGWQYECFAVKHHILAGYHNNEGVWSVQKSASPEALDVHVLRINYYFVIA